MKKINQVEKNIEHAFIIIQKVFYIQGEASYSIYRFFYIYQPLNLHNV